MRTDAHLAHDLEDLLAQGRIALPRPVLQCDGPAIDEHAGRRLSHHVAGQGLDEGHAAGQRHDLRPRCHGEQGPDLGGGHPAGAGRIGLDPGVETGGPGGIHAPMLH
jgi:hypothetical protein